MCPDGWHLDVHVLCSSRVVHWLLGSSQILGLECLALRSILSVPAVSFPPGPGDSNLLIGIQIMFRTCSNGFPYVRDPWELQVGLDPKTLGVHQLLILGLMIVIHPGVFPNLLCK